MTTHKHLGNVGNGGIPRLSLEMRLHMSEKQWHDVCAEASGWPLWVPATIRRRRGLKRLRQQLGVLQLPKE